MKLPPRIITHLSLMICGDQEYKDIFPYRSSSYLTDFFRSIDLPYVHGIQTRRWWIQGILDELNTGENPNNSDFPSQEIIKVIEQLVHPAEFVSTSLNRENAIIAMNNLLETEGFFIEVNNDTKKGKLKRHIGEFISTAVDEKKVDRYITFVPEVFRIPVCSVNPSLVSVMMPFSTEFGDVYNSIKLTCIEAGMECKRADEIWNSSEIIQDIFELIFSSKIVIVDLSERNPNVFYEMGIAHTLGKIVIPLIREPERIPFDVGHHRALRYTNSDDGLAKLRYELKTKLLSSNSEFK